MPEKLRIVVFSSGRLGREVANRLAELSTVEAVALMIAPFSQTERSLIQTVKRSIRYDGWLHTVAAAIRRLIPNGQDGDHLEGEDTDALRSDIPIRCFEAFESEAGLSFLHSFGPDLGVVAGTYILPEEVFTAPDRGSINLHSGKVPEYRGSAPGFWELYHDEDEVGVTVHTVTEELDAGEVLVESSAPLDSVPSVDPLRYLEEYRQAVLKPIGIQLLSLAVQQIAAGTTEPVQQDASRARTFPKPTFRQKRELRDIVRSRREESPV